MINQERDQFYHLFPIIILWKEENQPTNKQMKEEEIKLPPTKNQYENPIKKTPNHHTQSIIQKNKRNVIKIMKRCLSLYFFF